jgi:hypothetical protein
MWPAAEANMSSVMASIEKAREDMEKTINDRLGRGGASLAGF